MPVTIPNTLVAFGANEDSFFLGHGRRHTFRGVTDEFAAQVQGVYLPITQTEWISFDPTGLQPYIAKNDDRKQFCHSTDISQDLIGHLKTNGGSFITLGSGDNYFIKHNKGWNARLPPKHSENISQLKPLVNNFDSAVRGLLFGREQSHIFLFVGGFASDLNEETQNDAEHPLTKVLTEFDEGWCIEPGSTLCPYSDRYFFLKFKKPNDTVIQMRWSLPNSMIEELAELKQLAESPEDQIFLTQLRMVDMQHQQTRAALAMQQLRMQSQLNDMVCASMVQAGNSMKLATGGWIEVPRY
ncbi:hypothetical protein B0H13DRAFT_2054557 [Mycena leptocephala]|nr:hypothetical protein B0H13DRAFT_2054557 [Mycena leptocephala]